MVSVMLKLHWWQIPSYSSTPSQFIVTLPNLNYVTKTGVSPEKQDFEAEKQDFEAILNTLSLSKPIRKNVLALYKRFGLYEAFSRTDVVNICSIIKSPASSLISFMNESGLIEKTATRGKYRFIHSNSKWYKTGFLMTCTIKKPSLFHDFILYLIHI